MWFSCLKVEHLRKLGRELGGVGGEDGGEDLVLTIIVVVISCIFGLKGERLAKDGSKDLLVLTGSSEVEKFLVCVDRLWTLRC